MRSIAPSLAVLAALAQTAGAQVQSAFTLEQVLSAPFPYEATAAPGPAGRAAWVTLMRGQRSVWVASLATGRAARVANFPRDDGQDVSSLDLSRDGRTIAFVRGQGYNSLRENPNPASDPRGAEQAVWVSVGGAPARRLGRGWNPKVSPDGQYVVWQLDSTLMIAPAAPGVVQPRALFKARGVNQDPRWSPDGRWMAFSSNRGDHAFVGVYDRLRDSVRWMAPGVDRDASPRWSPDGKRLAFVRTDGGSAGGNVFAPTAGRGFGLWVGDPTTGTARELWHSAPGVEGRLRIPTAGEFFLWSGDHLVFFTEADGWQHLYSIKADGSQPAPTKLTTGECEVEEPSPTAAGDTIYFSSNCGDPAAGSAGAKADIDRKHIWRVATAGGAPEQLTRGSTIDYSPAVSGSAVLYLSGDAIRPPVPRIRTTAGREITVAGDLALPHDFPEHALVEPRAVLFKAADGLEIHGQLFVPRGADSARAKLTALVFMHGGPVRQMLLGWHPRGYYNRAYAMNQYLASRGFVVLSVNYRLGVGYGRAFREAERGGRRGASEYQDIVAAGQYLQTLPFVDANRIGLWGGSYGGYLTAYGMAKNPELFKAGVDLHGVHDWNARFSSFAPSATVGAREADSVLAVGRASSPVCCVGGIRGPLLLIQGDDDRNVAFSETVNLVQLLRRENKPFELLVFPDEVHDFLRHASWLAVYRATESFFDRTLVRGEAIGMR